MPSEEIELLSAAPGTRQVLTVHRFGTPGARPLVYIQAGLHADELPGVIAAHRLRRRLEALDRDGAVSGEVVLVPAANPIGLAQRVLGAGLGRFDLADGANFNRGFPWLGPEAAALAGPRLTGDAGANAGAVRDALAAALDRRPAATPAQSLKKTLLTLAVGADIVLDLHCDSEAVVHLYTLTPQEKAFAPLVALLGAEAFLLAEESGDDPFDEACSRPWLEMARRFPDHPFGPGCQAATVELRGGRDVSDELANRDAVAILRYLTLRGAVRGPADPAGSACPATPLAASEPIVADRAGLVLFHRAPGDRVRSGDVVAEIVDPCSGAVGTLRSGSNGVLYARSSSRFAHPGERLAKIAGTEIRRTGKLLSP